MTASYEREVHVAAAAAKEAGAAIRDLYDRAAAAIYTKGDGSPVTDADLAADRMIRTALTAAFPDDAILTEEGADDQARLRASRCWIVDPIDGTQQFVDRTGEFEVLIALVVDHRPVVGVLYQPVTDTLLAAAADQGAWVERGDLRTSLRLMPVAPDSPPRLLTSNWFGAPDNLPLLRQVAAQLGGAEPAVTPLGVSARQFIPPTPTADVLIGLNTKPDLRMAWEWDFAAPDIIVHEAGGRFTDLSGHLHRYNKPVPRNYGGLLLSVDPVTHDRVLAALKPQIARR